MNKFFSFLSLKPILGSTYNFFLLMSHHKISFGIQFSIKIVESWIKNHGVKKSPILRLFFNRGRYLM